MDTSTVISITTTILAFLVVGYFLWKSGKPVTAFTVQETYTKGLSLASELEKVGLMAVTAVEQLKETGRIGTDEEAFNVAFDYICSWPGLEKLDRKLIARAVEGSYHMYKQLREVQRGRETGVPGTDSLEVLEKRPAPTP